MLGVVPDPAGGPPMTDPDMPDAISNMAKIRATLE
jgi:hypothetical protein